MTILRKDQLELKLKDDQQLIRSGVLRNDHPLDTSETFAEFLEACRRGDLRNCQQMISAGININGKDQFDYTPLVIASLCGHYELVHLLLESGALADPDSFERERAVYNALNEKIRNLLVSYDYSKTADPLQPWSSHLKSLLTRTHPPTADIALLTSSPSAFHLHRFILAARTPYFRAKLADKPDLDYWRLTSNIPAEALHIVLRHLYLAELPRDLVAPGSETSEEDVARGVDKLCKQFEVPHVWDAVLSTGDRRLARQRHQDEVSRAQGQVEEFFEKTVLRHKIVLADGEKMVGNVRWPRENAIFANVLLKADEAVDELGADNDDDEKETGGDKDREGEAAIPVGPTASSSDASTPPCLKARKSVLYPAHKAFLIRSPFFETMFAGAFVEAQTQNHLRIIQMDCTPQVLEIVLTYLYSEKVHCPLEHALDLLYTSDMYLLDKLKTKAAMTIATLGTARRNAPVDRTYSAPDDEGTLDEMRVYDITRAAWSLDVPRLEQFAGKYFAERLEEHVEREEFAQLIRESAAKVKDRQETDTIELLDDIRYYLSERFRLRFEGEGLEEMLQEESQKTAQKELEEKGKGEGLEEGHLQEAIIVHGHKTDTGRTFRTLDGELVEDEFALDAMNYQILLGKLDRLLEKLELGA